MNVQIKYMFIMFNGMENNYVEVHISYMIRNSYDL